MNNLWSHPLTSITNYDFHWDKHLLGKKVRVVDHHSTHNPLSNSYNKEEMLIIHGTDLIGNKMGTQ